jgi:hypothetical protein
MMGDGFGQMIWFLLIVAMFAGSSVAVFVLGSIVSIWAPLAPWQLALASLGCGGLICLIFVAVYRP